MQRLQPSYRSGGEHPDNTDTDDVIAGNAESNRYNEEVFKNNLKFAILSQLVSPPEGFEEVSRAHFYLKRHSLIKELETQQELYKSKEVKKLVAEVKIELLKLEKPSVVKVAN